MHDNRWPLARPFVVVGVACVVAGGLVSAAFAHSASEHPAASEHASWAAAYLVLVVGVAQIGLGAGQAVLAGVAPPKRLVAVEFAVWTAGNGAVLLGTLLSQAVLTDVGGVLVVVALALFGYGVRGGTGGTNAGRSGVAYLRAYQVLIVVLLVSVPIGLLIESA